jgi:hypothetical protein
LQAGMRFSFATLLVCGAAVARKKIYEAVIVVRRPVYALVG